DSPLLGVNTPRRHEDRLKQMKLMVFLLQKDVCVGFGITAAHLYKFPLSDKCDVTRLQALVDKKKFVIFEDVIREILQLNDAEGVVCLPNEEIFTGLTQMGYEKPVGKGFSGVETPLFKTMLAVRDVAKEAKAQVPAQGDDIQEPAAEEVATDVVPPTLTLPSPSSLVIPSLPPNQSPCLPQPKDAEGSSLLFQRVLDTCSALTRKVEGLEHDKAAQQLKIVKLKARVKKLERINKVKSSKLRRLKKVGTSQRVKSSDDVENVFNQGRKIVDMDQDKRIELVQEAVEVVTTAKLMTKVVTTAGTQEKGVVIRDPEEELSSDTLAETLKVKYKGKGILIEAPKPMKKKDQIEMDAEYARKLQEEINKEHEESYKNIDWNTAFDHGLKYDEILPIFQAKFDANMRFLFKTREEMEAEDEEIIKSINETPAQKAAKRKKLDEEAQAAEALKKQLEIVHDEDDDVFTEATPIGRKVPVVNYEIVMINNKPRIVKDRFSTSKPTNFSDDYLLSTLKTMFEKTDGQDAIWRNQQSVYGQALVKSWKLLTSCGVHIISLTTTSFILLVERRYPLSKFTLEQLVNVARIQVEEESEMSLELLRFTRQQLQEYQQG
nr:hypothetical protein [Tanacetum cinerariifolium]